MRLHLLLLLAPPLFAQAVSVGVKVGASVGDPMGRNAESQPYIVGPTVEVALRAGFAVEASALYRRLGYSYSFNYGPQEAMSGITAALRGNAWEFPLIGKYYFRERREKWQPYLGTGWALRTVGWDLKGSTVTTDSSGRQVSTPIDSHDRSELGVGATVVAGVRLRVGHLSLLPEARFTRWGSHVGYSSSRKNEGGFFLAFRF